MPLVTLGSGDGVLFVMKDRTYRATVREVIQSTPIIYTVVLESDDPELPVKTFHVENKQTNYMRS